jgi:hypothetical protein
MKILATTGAVLLLSGLSVTGAAAGTMPTKPGSNPSVITISCFRGPSSNVIWDRPNAVFIEDLVKIGYSYQKAHAIGERVCRDEYGVSNPEYLKSTLIEIMARTPPSS